MRNAFASEITNLAISDSRIVLLSGDIGNRLFNPYKDACPARFYNCGVAEANMTGVAAGMAMCGLRPVTYTITPFNTFRCLEQIRVDICYQNLPVVIVGVGSGLAYAGLGATHHSCEDISIMRSIPNMSVVCPGDAIEVRLAVKEAIKNNGPTYIRLGKKNEPVVHSKLERFCIGKGIVIQEGNDVCILNTGNTLPLAVEVGAGLEQKGISTQVVSMHTVKPLDVELLRDRFSRFKRVVTIEEHNLIGGLGASVAEWALAEKQSTRKLRCFGLPDQFFKGCGTQENAREKTGLTAANIMDTVYQEMTIGKLNEGA